MLAGSELWNGPGAGLQTERHRCVLNDPDTTQTGVLVPESLGTQALALLF